MSTTIQELYNQVIRTLPPTERLRLATLILNDLVEKDTDIIDYSDTWTAQDQLDLVNFSLQYSVLDANLGILQQMAESALREDEEGKTEAKGFGEE